MKTSTFLLAFVGAALAKPVAVPEKVERGLEPRVLDLGQVVPNLGSVLPVSSPVSPPAGDLDTALTTIVKGIITAVTNILTGLPVGSVPGNLTIPTAANFPGLTSLPPITSTVSPGTLTPQVLLVQLQDIQTQLSSLYALVSSLGSNGGGLNPGQLTLIRDVINQVISALQPLLSILPGLSNFGGGVSGGFPIASIQGLVTTLTSLVGTLQGIITGLLGGGA